MPLWRCPHCGTPQAESSRCWVCRRSTTSCATCRHFRRGVASGLGLCGLDPRRLALQGTEMHACWVAPDPVVDPVAPDRAVRSASPASGDARDGSGHRARTFVPVDELERAGQTPVVARARPAADPARDHPGWSLWADLEG